MDWTPITSPDAPGDFEVVFVSDGVSVGLAFRNPRDPEFIKRMEAREDGWTFIWPVNEDKKKIGPIIKYMHPPKP